ncbi:MAG: hypothetical protein ACM3NO_08360 [Deltaproteobacteria bacterium]
MSPFDDDLRKALKRIEPPEGFADRVVARASLEGRPRQTLASRLRALFVPRTVRWAAAMAVVCLVVVVGALRYREVQRERRQGEIASAQAKLALEIASAKLNAVFKDAARSSHRNLEN